MVLINEKKYACETCIKGHRSSGCKHTDRPLYEIKKKGRPVTQCEHCRELRKTKQVHVKCICPKGERSEQVFQGHPKGISKMLQSPAFPNGLPEALEASITIPLLPEAMSSDSEHGTCKKCMSTSGDCHCSHTLYRRSSKNSRIKDEMPTNPTLASFPPSSSKLIIPQPLNHAAAGRAHFLDMVSQTSSSYTRHHPHPHHDLHHNHAHQHQYDYSPYGRAYNHARPNHVERHQPQVAQYDFPLEGASSEHPYSQSSFSRSSSSMSPSTHEAYNFDTAEMDAWKTFEANTSSDISKAICSCDDTCACSPCSVHHPNTQNRLQDFSTCAQSDTRCVRSDVYYQSQIDLPQNTALSIYRNQDDPSGVIDAWIKQTQGPLSRSPPDVDIYRVSSPISYSYYESSCQLAGDSAGEANPYTSRARTLEDFQTFDGSKAGNLNYRNAGLYQFSSEYGNTNFPYGNVASASALDSMLMDSLAAELADVIHRSRSASTSESETSSESEVSEQSGEMNPFPMYYRHAVGPGSDITSSERDYSRYGPGSSTSSLSDTLSYF
ncbi:hypothetical protein D9757_007575 [Collybiopsis confluens]|uniref:Copper-fist domain-containing protein n=1 Tax=Collybiopsis confluens TaxID=2823264 RepID=A0A8H5HF19_9AGAR|nr:hypothetical protein D9757_007575 [Collybiopsis confluens]